MKLKALAAAIALAVSGAASAAPIAVDGLFLSIRDQSNNNSFVANLGTTTTQFLANPNAPYTLGGQALTALSSFLSGRDLSSIVWNVTGLMNGPYGSTTYGGLTTSTNIETAPQDWGHFNGLDAVVNNYTLFRNNVNADLASVDGVGYASGDLKGFFAPANNGGVASIQSLGSVGQSLKFYAFFAAQPNDGFTELFEGDYSGPLANANWAWKLDFNGTNANLTYSAATAPVPVPAAVWLLGSALIGMVGVSRRKKA
jgi:hypothetical protein